MVLLLYLKGFASPNDVLLLVKVRNYQSAGNTPGILNANLLESQADIA